MSSKTTELQSLQQYCLDVVVVLMMEDIVFYISEGKFKASWCALIGPNYHSRDDLRSERFVFVFYIIIRPAWYLPVAIADWWQRSWKRPQGTFPVICSKVNCFDH